MYTDYYEISIVQDKLVAGKKLYEGVHMRLFKINNKEADFKELAGLFLGYKYFDNNMQNITKAYNNELFTQDEAIAVKKMLLKEMPFATVFLHQKKLPILPENIRPVSLFSLKGDNKFLIINEIINKRYTFGIWASYTLKNRESRPLFLVK
jgi:hypothetical protein